MISESLKYCSEMVCMISLSARIDQNIIYEDYDEHVQVLLEHRLIKSMKATGVLARPKDINKNLK